jgi:hypothetical protein
MVKTGHQSPTGDADLRVDELRQRLRALGYLDAGVDRFVLGPAQSARRPLVFALLSAVRVGAVAAALLGPATTLGVAVRVPGLVTGPRDAFVVALYLGVAFGAAMAVTTLAAALAIVGAVRLSPALVARRAGLLPRIAGAIVGVACLVYLTFWWRAVVADVGWSAPLSMLWTTSALAIAAAISLLLGHAVAVVASAIIIAFAGGAAPRQTSRRTAIVSGAVAFGGAALLLTWSGAAHAVPDAPPPLTVVSSGVRVKVIAIDGFDPQVFAELSASRRVPALTAAFSGAVAQLAAGLDGTPDPARTWTTVATGQPPNVHGVRGLETRRVAGVGGAVTTDDRAGPWTALRNVTDLLRFTRPALVSGSERRVKTFWEVAAAAGLRTAVVNWWVTWPATSSDAIVISDRATLRLEHGGDLDAEMTPASLFPQLREAWPALKAQALNTALRFEPDHATGPIAKLVGRSAELDALQLGLQKTVTSSATDLSVVYLPGLDIVQHTLLGEQASGAAASTLSERLAAIKNYYVTLDGLLASYGVLEPQADEMVIVVTQPGRIGDVGTGRLAARGRQTSPARTISGSQVDVAPTLLYALGLPLASDLAGKPIVGVFASEFTSAYAVRSVSTYGAPVRTPVARTGKPLEQEAIDRLRSLGYVR